MRTYDLTEEQLAGPDIAIVGMAVRLPGASNVRAFWDNLAHGRESVRTLADQELLQAGVSALDLRAANYVKACAALDGVDLFDARFFGFSPREARVLDPQHRHFLEVCWEALEDAGVLPERFHGSVGVFAGSGMNAYLPFNLLTNPDLIREMGLFLVRHTGNDKDFLATRVSYCLNLRGPSVNVQTACSTSLVAIHLACQSLLSGECSLALAGGVTIELPHSRGYYYEEGEILSPDGHCRPFEASSKGTVFGSGAGVVALRRLSDAVRDGDYIHAVIKGAAINNDGSRKPGYLAPSVDGQAECIAEALSVAGLEAEQISYVECHGTGTPVGDPIEIAALAEAFGTSAAGPNSCGIGSVKSNIGHLDTAAGVASLVKVVEMLKHEQLVPTLHFERPNPEIPFATTPFYVVAAPAPWPRTGTPRRAGVSSLGVGGTNAHLIVEEPPRRSRGPAASREPQLLLLSARSQASLGQLAAQLAAQLEQQPELELGDVSATLLTGRRKFPFCRVLAASTPEEARRLLTAPDGRRVFDVSSSTKPLEAVFVFPGGGAQYPHMARAVYETQPAFRARMDECLEILERREQLSLRTVLFPESGSEAEQQRQLERPFFALPALLTVELAYAALLASWGVKPVAMVGHSVGEYAAAYLASVLSLEDALRIVCCRGRLFEKVTPGGMLSVPLSVADMSPLLGPRLTIAAVNAPEMCVVSGENAELDALVERLRARAVESQRLHIDIAAHSPLLDAILGEFERELATLRFAAPRIPYVSNLSGAFMDASVAPDAGYFVRHLRNTVRFSDCVRALGAQHPDAVLLEVGPGQALTSLLRNHPLRPASQPVLSVSPHARDKSSEAGHVITALGRLHAHGVPVDLGVLLGSRARRVVSLVTTPFEHERHWVDAGAGSIATAVARESADRETDLSRWLFAPVFRESARSASSLAAGERCCVMIDAGPLADALVHELEARGSEVTLIMPGAETRALGAGKYSLVLGDPDAYDQLFASLIAERGAPTRILHALCLERESASGREPPLDRSFFSLLHLAQVLTRADALNELQLVVATRRACDLAGTSPERPLQALALGPVLVLPRELPEVQARIYDLEETEDAERTARSLVAELSAPSEHRVLAERGRVRYVELLERVAPGKLAAPELPAAPVFLFSGGLGGMALTLARAVAEEHGARLVLLSRTVPENVRGTVLDERQSEIAALAAQGCEVMVVQADVTSTEQVQRAVASALARFGRIDVVVHAAGVIDDAPLALKSRDSARAVLAPKVDGADVLIAALAGAPPKHWISLSSTSAVIGPAGQVDYVAANAYANARARCLAREWPSVRVSSLGFGVWRETGMAARLAGVASDAQSGRDTGHPLLGRERALPNGDLEFLARYRARDLWVLDEHRVRGAGPVFPGTGFLELVRAAGARALGVEAGDLLEVQDLTFLTVLEVPEEGEQHVRIRVAHSAMGSEQAVAISVAAKGASARGYTEHAQARVVRRARAPQAILPLANLRSRLSLRHVVFEEGRQVLPQDRALSFGPRWKVLRNMRFGEGEALASLCLPARFAGDLAELALHPGLLDMASGFAFGLVDGASESGARVRVPLGYERVRVFGTLQAELQAFVRCRAYDPLSGAATFDVSVAAPNGQVLVEIDGYTTRSVAPAALRRAPEASPAETLLERWIKQGITRAEGSSIFARVLAAPHLGTHYASPISLYALEEELRPKRLQAPAATSSAPSTSAALEAADLPRDDIERRLVATWQTLLGVSHVGIRQNFFDLGGHSLIAVRLFSRMKKEFGVDLSLSVLFEAPTLEGTAQLIRSALGRSLPDTPEAERAESSEPLLPPPASAQGFSPLVLIQAGRGELPFFCVHGAGGNVLNFRDLARGLGADQPFYGLQAQGVRGDSPLESIEAMAALYLRAIASVQARGPYMLGGYSGGGVVAYEMAQRLVAAGEQVGLLVFLDTFHPGATPKRPSLGTQLRRVWQGGIGDLVSRVGEKLSNDRENRAEARKLAFMLREGLQLPIELVERRLTEAFLLASASYVPQRYAGPVTLFRAETPAEVYRHVSAKLGWDQLTPALRVIEVPGGHHSLMREPNVHVLTAHLREALRQAVSFARVHRAVAPAADSDAAAPSAVDASAARGCTTA
jgi:acyl transferase domain-containing protein/thioesterase domain-containing protein/acyl carrier protein